MRVLHTSDWHLGVSLETAPRHEEHTEFLRWLYAELEERQIEVLLISGDVYHYAQPSAAAQAEFFGFLAKCDGLSSLRHIVVVAGNHDSPSRLEAPRQVLETVGVTVIGNLDVDESGRAIVPLFDGETCEAVVIAVPYLSESRLGIATTDKSPEALRTAYRARFAQLYDDLLKTAQAEHPDVPVFAMGHMTCVDESTPVQDGDFNTPIHSFTSLFGLPTDIFSKSYDYVALGHIHRCHQVGERQIWYSGSPVPISVVEARSPRYVLVSEIGSDVRTRKVKVPRWRDVFEIEGDPQEVADLVRTLVWESELPPYLYLDVLVEPGQHVDVDRYQNLIARSFPDERLPRIVRFRTRANVEVQESEDADDHARDLQEMVPEDVFIQMYRAKYEEPPPERIISTFRELLVEES